MKQVRITAPFSFGASTHDYGELIEEYGLRADSVCKAVKKALVVVKIARR
jgi:hypothetical protein